MKRKYIKGYGKRYTIMPDSRVYSIRRRRFLMPQLRPDGRIMVNLWENGRTKRYYIHRLVALHFLKNPENKPEVNHINGDPKDNRIENLEWATSSENHKHAYKIGLMKSRKKRVEQYTKEGELIWVYDSVAEATNQKGVCQSGISQCINGAISQHGGFIWRA